MAALFTTVLLDDANTSLALDVAAPVELAIAALLDHDLLGIVAATAAQNRAAIQTRRRFVAHTVQSAYRSKAHKHD